jgi:hypothetical protein
VNELIDLFSRVLILNISDDLEPTFHFFTERIGIDEARSFVANHPQVMGASSENRLQFVFALGSHEPRKECSEPGASNPAGR